MTTFKNLFNTLTPARFYALLVMTLPLYASATWYDPIVNFAREFQTALIIIGGTMAIGSLVFVGVCWIISRMAGTSKTTAMDYVEQIAVIGTVGGAIAAATWAYQIWGGKIS
ncbi:hypothetical protein [Serratia symbiotica]|uniref:hypothetical protein n=1 Tax=Serratia symbiotica TaxID=138074 RepID=UPI001CF0AF6D|nr:hypothetical protein [Serratia symbiotica]